MRDKMAGIPKEARTVKSILLICPFPLDIAPAQRLKYEQYIDHWRENGYRVVVSPFMSRPLFDVAWEKGHLLRKVVGTLGGYCRRLYDVMRARRYDLVYVFLWVTPIGPSLSERVLRFCSKKLVYDIDDNVHIGQNLPDSTNPNRLLRLIKGRSKPIYLMKTSDYVVASSPFLADAARELNRYSQAEYITSSVDVHHFAPRAKRPDNPKCVIGWTGTFSSQPFLDALAPMLRKLRETHEFEFRIIGNFDYDMAGVDLKVVRFRKSTEIEDLAHFDVGIYPLVDDPFVYGKSGLKAIVYMAMGLPVVASAVGTTPLLYEHGDIGFMVRDEDEWRSALATLLERPDLRAKFGATAREVAVENYSREAVRERYLRVLDQVSGRTGGGTT
jgi:glycosyltransferase involved in cell wall biosynthesis